MIFTALDEAASKGELILWMDGLCRYHARKDGVVVIREVIVLPFRRRTGLGRRLIGEVLRRHPRATLRARCPQPLPANAFWLALGFGIAWTEKGNNVWERYPE